MIDRTFVKDGMTVRSADGDRLGKIVEIDDQGFTVEKGIFFPKDYRASFDQVEHFDNDEVYLKWGTNLVEERYDSVYGQGSYDTETRDTNMWADFRRDRSADADTSRASSEEVNIPLREERLDVERKGMKDVGRVRIVKTVRTEDKHFTVPLRREEVRIERVPSTGESRLDSDRSADMRDETINIPIREEEVSVSKRPVLKEEVRVTKESETVERPVSGEVRSEDVHIERDDIDRTSDIERKKAV